MLGCCCIDVDVSLGGRVGHILGQGPGRTNSAGRPMSVGVLVFSCGGRIVINEVFKAEFVQHKYVRLERARLLPIGKPAPCMGNGIGNGAAQGQGAGKGASRGTGNDGVAKCRMHHSGSAQSIPRTQHCVEAQCFSIAVV